MRKKELIANVSTYLGRRPTRSERRMYAKLAREVEAWVSENWDQFDKIDEPITLMNHQFIGGKAMQTPPNVFFERIRCPARRLDV